MLIPAINGCQQMKLTDRLITATSPSDALDRTTVSYNKTSIATKPTLASSSWVSFTSCFFFFFEAKFAELEMGSFEQQLKKRAKELKTLFKKGVKIVGDSCKKGWHKVKHMRR